MFSNGILAKIVNTMIKFNFPYFLFKSLFQFNKYKQIQQIIKLNNKIYFKINLP